MTNTLIKNQFTKYKKKQVNENFECNSMSREVGGQYVLAMKIACSFVQHTTV